jgi:hypothetical protein
MKAIIIISGFTQKLHQETGSKKLWRKMRLNSKLYSNPDVLVELKEWDSDWRNYARYINSYKPSEVLICAYSWGNHGLIELSKRLDRRVVAVLCDPVKRSRTIFGRWKALFDRKIKLPDNVDLVGWISQRGDILDGDPVVGKGKICEEVILDYTHTQIDNSQEYHNLAFTAVKDFIVPSTTAIQKKEEC